MFVRLPKGIGESPLTLRKCLKKLQIYENNTTVGFNLELDKQKNL